MSGIIFFSTFIFFGIVSANRVLRHEPVHIRVWFGTIFGILGLMWGVVPFSFFMGFSKLSNLLALLLMFVICLAVLLFCKIEQDEVCDMQYDHSMFFVVLPITLLICYLLSSHVIAPSADGALYGGQSTFGDLSMHLGIITSIAEQGLFPPDYSIFPGVRLSYPFLADSLSSSLYVFGTPLRWAVLVPSYITVFALVSGFYILSVELLKKKPAAVISLLLFFFNGGFGFIYFMDGLKIDKYNFKRMFEEFYHTPTNYNENFIRWSNTICDMIIPQRTLMVGWAVAILVFWLLLKAISDNRRSYFLFAGVTTGLIPMVHTHSFLAVGIIAAVWFLVFLFQAIDRKEYIYNWSAFIIPSLLLSVPQLFFWTLPQASAGSFLKLHFNWANEGDVWLWFWVKNVGLVFILLLPALFSAGKRMLSFFSGPAVLFIIADTVVFQPNYYDNNKLFYIWYVFAVMIVATYIYRVYEKIKELGGGRIVLGIILFTCTFSGFLTVGREIKSRYMLYNSINVEAADFIKENTPKDALFLTSDQHLNPVAALAGRNIVSGSPAYLNFHGIRYSERSETVDKMFSNSESFRELAAEYGVDYVYFSNYEKDRFGELPDFLLQDYRTIFRRTIPGETIYVFAISERAVKSGVESIE